MASVSALIPYLGCLTGILILYALLAWLRDTVLTRDDDDDNIWW